MPKKGSAKCPYGHTMHLISVRRFTTHDHWCQKCKRYYPAPQENNR